MSGILLLVIRFVMAFALYAFLFWAVFTLWRDMKRQKDLVETRKIPELTITEQIDDQTKSHSYNVPELVVGRDQTCDLVFDASTVSAEHARISYHQQNWWIEDLGSRNGTLLNLDRVSTAAILVSGDELQLGEVLLVITIDNESDQLSPS
jgi:pSer/pThr/pTyr-binding forkhead associated (FHA) protein